MMIELKRGTEEIIDDIQKSKNKNTVNAKKGNAAAKRVK